MITTSTPGKLMLFGDHSVVYGHPCIVTAVDQRLYVSVKKNGVDVFHLSAPSLGLEAYSKTIDDLGKKQLPKAVRFIEHLYKRFLEQHPQAEGIIVTTRSEFSASFGFGSSSAVTVAFAKALCELYQIELSHKQLFDLCYQAVLDVQGVGSGFDIAAAIWGGTIYYVSPAKVVESLVVENLPLVVGYTGVKADTATIVRMVALQRTQNRHKIDSYFDQAGQLVDQAKVAMETKNWNLVGKLMRQNQTILTDLHVSSLELDRLISAAEQAGAEGAKLSGAGGGDCMIALAQNETQKYVKQAIAQAGGEIMDVAINAQGVRVEGNE